MISEAMFDPLRIWRGAVASVLVAGVISGCGNDTPTTVVYDPLPPDEETDRIEVPEAALRPGGDRIAEIHLPSTLSLDRALLFEGIIEVEPTAVGGIAIVELTQTGKDGKPITYASGTAESESAGNGRAKYRLTINSLPKPGRYHATISYLVPGGNPTPRVAAEGDLEVAGK